MKENILDERKNTKYRGLLRVECIQTTPDEHYKDNLKTDKVVVLGFYALLSGTFIICVVIIFVLFNIQ